MSQLHCKHTRTLKIDGIGQCTTGIPVPVLELDKMMLVKPGIRV